MPAGRYMQPMPVTLGLVSDTHGLVRPEALAALAGVDRVLHAGDVGKPEVLGALAEVAPVVAVRGNVDRGAWAEALPERVELCIEGWRHVLVHDVSTVGPLEGAQIVVHGHSHRPRDERIDGVRYLNPGSIGPRRFSLPVAMARLTLAPGRLQLHPQVLALDR